MRAFVLTVGSRGDVQPFVALAAGLQASGHDAVLAAPAMFGALAAASGVPFVPLDLDMNEVGAALADRRGLSHLVRFCQLMGRRAEAALPGATEAARSRSGAPAAPQSGTGASAVVRSGADVVVHHPVLPLGQHLAELLGVPAVVAQPIPVLVPTGEFPSAAWPYRLPPIVNRPSYRVARQLSGLWCRRDIDRWRRDELHLPPRRGRHDPLRSADGTPVTVLHSFSAHVVPRPADWPATAHVTGYWMRPAEQDESPPRRLAEFVERAGSVVYIGFGSMPGPDPERLAAAMIAAADQSGTRAVVTSLSPVLRRLLPSSRFLVLRNAPHGWLFPRMQAIVHHGGAGTTAAAIVSGRPQVIWPFGIDQPFWARRMAALGVAPPARPVGTLTSATFTAALDRALGDRAMTERAAELGVKVRAEDGLGQAIARLENLVAGTRPAGLVAGRRLAVGA